MQGLMMDYPLTIDHILNRARRYFPENEIVTRVADGTHRYTWGDLGARAERLASALTRLGVGRGTRVGSFAWNSYRHMEAYFAVPCMGAVIHTINFRLAPDQLVHVINHAGDEVVLVDASVFPALAGVRDRLTTVRHVVVMDDVGQGIPADTLDYEELLADASPSFSWPELDEREAAGMCYTSGTTGHPKGCVYSHRSQVLHTLAIGLKGCIGLSESDVALVIVPMFHANAWGMPYAAAMIGMKLVLPGRFMQPSDLADLIQAERVTYIAGVPTIVAAIYQSLKHAPRDVSSLRLVTVGGAPLPRVLLEGFERDFSAHVVQGWGMTEMSPVGSLSMLKRTMTELPSEEQTLARLKAGLPLPFVDVRIVDEGGRALPSDGQASGELQVRGPWIIGAYYDDPRNAEAFQGGWFRTGDIATVDGYGFIQIVDRTKDLVKSGGEWISSVDLENAIMGHPGVAEAAVIAVAHPKWTERPLACVVAKAWSGFGPRLDSRLSQGAGRRLVAAGRCRDDRRNPQDQRRQVRQESVARTVQRSRPSGGPVSRLALGFLALMVAAPLAGQATPDSNLARARRALRLSPLVDGHNDLPWRIREDTIARGDPEKYDLRGTAPGHTDIARLRRGMVGAQFWSIYIPGEIRDSGYARVQLEQFDIARRVIAKYPDVFAWTPTAAGVRRAFAQEKIGSLLGLEGGHAIENSLGALRLYYEMGARYMTLTHNVTLDWADAALDSTRHSGLTRFGEEVVREMNRLGMLVDLSHVSPATMSDALNVTGAPVIFSHSAARALVNHRRNVPDSILARLPSERRRRHGAVRDELHVPRAVPVAEDSARLGRNTADSAALRSWLASNPRPIARLTDVADHIDHIRRVAGVEHVGIGSDYDGIDETPEGLADVSAFPALFAELARRGWSVPDLQKLAGENVLRVLGRAEVVAARLKKERPPSAKTIAELDRSRPAVP